MQPDVGLLQLEAAMRSTLATIAVVGLSGCLCNENTCVATGAPVATTQLGTTGEPVTARIVLPTNCGTRVATSAQASVLDPEGMSAATTVGEPSSVAGEGFVVGVTFTPFLPGPYHVVARFEPNFGLGQLDVIVAAERRDAGSVTLPLRCARGDFTPGGLALCTTDAGVEVFSGTTGLRTLPGMVARAGGTVWVSDGGRVQRWSEDGGDLELVAEATAAAHQVLVPSADEVLVIKTLGSAVQRWADGGFVNLPMIVAPNSDVWRRGDALVSVASGTSGWCVTSLTTGTKRCDTTSMLGIGGRLGLESAGIWAEQASSVAGTEALLFDDRSVRSFPLPGDGTLSSAGTRWESGVWIESRDAGGPYVLRAQGDEGITLENYGGIPRSVTSTCVTFGSGNSTRLVHR